MIEWHRLAQSFFVSDVMTPREGLIAVAPGEEDRALAIMQTNRFTVVPSLGSDDGIASVFLAKNDRVPESLHEIREHGLIISDFLPERTPLSEVVSLLLERSWFIALRANCPSGLLTYWDLNKSAFRVQAFTKITRFESLARDALARDRVGVGGADGLLISAAGRAKAEDRFLKAKREFAGNRFVDCLEFHDLLEAISRHGPWATFSDERPDRESQRAIVKLRDTVMHGRTMFETHQDFRAFVAVLAGVEELVDVLDRYTRSAARGPSLV